MFCFYIIAYCSLADILDMLDGRTTVTTGRATCTEETKDLQHQYYPFFTKVDARKYVYRLRSNRCF